MPGKRARPVRRGAVGKGPVLLAPRRRPTLPCGGFGKGPTEKDPHCGHLTGGLLHSGRGRRKRTRIAGTSPAAYFTLRGVRRSNAPHLPDSHQPTHQRERAIKRFTSPGHAQRFLSAFSGISPHFRPRRHRLTAAQYRHEMTTRFTTWNQVTGLAPTAA